MIYMILSVGRKENQVVYDTQIILFALLKRFAMKYYPNEQMVDEEIARVGKAVQLFEIEIEHLSGKEVQER